MPPRGSRSHANPGSCWGQRDPLQPRVSQLLLPALTLLGAHLPSRGDPSPLQRPHRLWCCRLQSAAVMGKGEPSPAASPHCGQLGCSPGQGTEQTLCAPICRPRKENIPGIHPAPREAPRGSEELPPQQGWEQGWGWSSMPHHSRRLGGLGGIRLWEPAVPARPRWAPGRGWTQHGEVTACGCCLAGAAVRTRNYGFRLARGKQGCRRATLPARTAKGCTMAREPPRHACQVPLGRRCWQGHGQAGERPWVVPQPCFPPKHTHKTQQC